jgi:hypothetical protein
MGRVFFFLWLFGSIPNVFSQCSPQVPNLFPSGSNNVPSLGTWLTCWEHIGNNNKKSLILQKKRTHIEKIPIFITLLPCVSLTGLLCIKGVSIWLEDFWLHSSMWVRVREWSCCCCCNGDSLLELPVPPRPHHTWYIFVLHVNDTSRHYTTCLEKDKNALTDW